MISLAATPSLTTRRLILRAPQAQDFPHWQTFAQSDRAAFVGGPMTEANAWRAFCHVIGMWVLRGYGTFIIQLKDDPTPIGMCGPWYPLDWPEAELGWSLWQPEAEGQGFAFEATSAARDHAFSALGWTSAVSYIDPANSRSIALAKRLDARPDASAARPFPADDVLAFRHRKPASAA